MKKAPIIVIIVLIAAVVVLAIKVIQTKKELKEQTQLVTEQTEQIKILEEDLEKEQEFRAIAEKIAEHSELERIKAGVSR